MRIWALIRIWAKQEFWPIRVYGLPVRVWAAHTCTGIPYAYGLPVCVWAAHMHMGQPIRVWAEYLYGTEHHSKNCGVHSTPNSCHTIGCESHQPKFGVLCTPSHGVTVSWCAQHTNLVCYAHQL